jgi:glycine betaine/proline transport system substrate-binding protein
MNVAWKTMLTTGLVAGATLSAPAWAKLPGDGITVQPVQSTVAEETFQTLIVNKAMEALGYTVRGLHLHQRGRCHLSGRELGAAA